MFVQLPLERNQGLQQLSEALHDQTVDLIRKAQTDPPIVIPGGRDVRPFMVPHSYGMLLTSVRGVLDEVSSMAFNGFITTEFANTLLEGELTKLKDVAQACFASPVSEVHAIGELALRLLPESVVLFFESSSLPSDTETRES